MPAASGAGAGAGRTAWLLPRGTACLAGGAGDGENSPACGRHAIERDLIIQITRWYQPHAAHRAEGWRLGKQLSH